VIGLRNDVLEFSFSEVHPDAKVRISFMRTLRIPDDNREYFLPPGLGEFPLRNVDEFADNIHETWLGQGGVMLPMYQSEAMWLHFSSRFRGDWEYDIDGYPFAIKISTGNINAVTGDVGSNVLTKEPQNYLIIPKQPWLDGYCVEEGVIRQFVAMPLGAGYSAEEQITGKGDYGGLQIEVYPMKRKIFEQLFPRRNRNISHTVYYSPESCNICCEKADMGLAPGGRMKQEIYKDTYGIDAWDIEHQSRCFVHIANSLVWRSITGENPPTTPFTAKEYTEEGLPWFDYYDETTQPLKGSKVLDGLKSVVQKGKEKGDVPLSENTPVTNEYVIKLRAGLKKHQVREGLF
jgi:hypothetical protein